MVTGQNISKYEIEIAKLDEKQDLDGFDEIDVARQGQLRLWYERKEMYWRQLSRDNSIRLKDRNTKFFHAVAIWG